ncbi:MAG: YjjG family noncanonical pyrimidine nucleotidase [Schleiferiaceae bacterium]|jgi:putative hydrolase of the HAD superfamily|nr:YjjG family noncanonical pyrimidine nucleotidase [Schleiferiaceae bacterium]
MPKAYKHIFFDLDHTLWDFDKNSEETLEELFEVYSLKELGIEAFEDFLKTYRRVNDQMWDQYRKKEITKAELRATRFYNTLLEFEIDHPELASTIDADYISKSPYKTHVFPHTHEILEYLAEKYELHIITNGFSEVQDIKMEHSKLKSHFKHKITSEMVGVTKPDPKIFTHALRLAGSHRNEALMIGDNLAVDVIGARNVGIDQVYFNPDRKPHEVKVTHEIQNLIELKNFL